MAPMDLVIAAARRLAGTARSRWCWALARSSACNACSWRTGSHLTLAGEPAGRRWSMRRSRSTASCSRSSARRSRRSAICHARRRPLSSYAGERLAFGGDEVRRSANQARSSASTFSSMRVAAAARSPPATLGQRGPRPWRRPAARAATRPPPAAHRPSARDSASSAAASSAASLTSNVDETVVRASLSRRSITRSCRSANRSRSSARASARRPAARSSASRSRSSAPASHSALGSSVPPSATPPPVAPTACHPRPRYSPLPVLAAGGRTSIGSRPNRWKTRAGSPRSPPTCSTGPRAFAAVQAPTITPMLCASMKRTFDMSSTIVAAVPHSTACSSSGRNSAVERSSSPASQMTTTSSTDCADQPKGAGPPLRDADHIIRWLGHQPSPRDQWLDHQPATIVGSTQTQRKQSFVSRRDSRMREDPSVSYGTCLARWAKSVAGGRPDHGVEVPSRPTAATTGTPRFSLKPCTPRLPTTATLGHRRIQPGHADRANIRSCGVVPTAAVAAPWVPPPNVTEMSGK